MYAYSFGDVSAQIFRGILFNQPMCGHGSLNFHFLFCWLNNWQRLFLDGKASELFPATF